jgi:hypothetical protein
MVNIKRNKCNNNFWICGDTCYAIKHTSFYFQFKIKDS